MCQPPISTKDLACRLTRCFVIPTSLAQTACSLRNISYVGQDFGELSRAAVLVVVLVLDFQARGVLEFWSNALLKIAPCAHTCCTVNSRL
jgi:hypothetical protein